MMRFHMMLAPLAFLTLTACDHMPPSFVESFESIGSAVSSLQVPTVVDDVVLEPVAKDHNIIEVNARGLSAWLVEDNSLPLVSVQLMFEGAGSSSDMAGKEGRAMFAAALLDEGAGKLNALAFQQALDDQAIQLSFTTDQDVLVADIRCLSESLPEAFRLLGLALTQPNFNAKDIERKRAQALSTLKRASTNPNYVLREHVNAMAFANHPYGQPEMGTEQSLQSIQRGDLQNYVAQALTKDHLRMSVTGDVTAEALKALMETHLHALPDTSMLPATPDITLKHQGQMLVVELDVPQSQVLLATPAVARRDDRFLAAYILNHIVGGNTLNSVLGNAIREKQGLAYSVTSYLDPMSHASSFKARFATKNEQAHQALATLKEELIAIGKQGVTEAQFEDALDYITGSFVLSLDNNTNYTRYLNTMQRFDLGKDYLQTRNHAMRAVTREQVNQLAKEMFDPAKWLIVAVGKPEQLESGNITK